MVNLVKPEVVSSIIDVGSLTFNEWEGVRARIRVHLMLVGETLPLCSRALRMAWRVG